MTKDLSELLAQDTGGFRFMFVMVNPADGSIISRWKVGSTATENGETVAIPAVDARQGEPSEQYDTALNDSDKGFTVTVGKVWRLLSIWVEYTSTATAGDRQLAIEFKDNSSAVIGRVIAGATQAASLTRYYMFAPGLPDLAAFRDTDHLTTPLPDGLELGGGFSVRVYDRNAVDPAADDMIVRMMVKERDA